jgi:hypothetical protein
LQFTYVTCVNLLMDSACIFRTDESSVYRARTINSIFNLFASYNCIEFLKVLHVIRWFINYIFNVYFLIACPKIRTGEAESIFRIAKVYSYHDLVKFVNKPHESEVELIL